MIKYFEEEHVRTRESLSEILAEAIPFIADRYFDKKNVAKGTHLNMEPLENHRCVQKEALEASQAYREGEGVVRECEELADTMLFSAYRIHKIAKEHKELWNERK